MGNTNDTKTDEKTFISDRPGVDLSCIFWKKSSKSKYNLTMPTAVKISVVNQKQP